MSDAIKPICSRVSNAAPTPNRTVGYGDLARVCLSSVLTVNGRSVEILKSKMICCLGVGMSIAIGTMLYDVRLNHHHCRRFSDH